MTLEKSESAVKEAVSNTVEELIAKFDKLLLGLNTAHYAFKSDEEKEQLIKRITNYVNYRLKDLKDFKDTQIYKLLLKISKTDYQNIKQLEDIFSKVWEQRKFIKVKYFKVRERELGRKAAERNFKFL